MTQKYSCKQLSAKIDIIKSKRADFDVLYKQGDVKSSTKLMKEIILLINEVKKQIWILEILTEENIANQYDNWEEAYKALGFEHSLPSKERVFQFLRKDRNFMELMSRKEKQGLSKMIIAPAPGFYSLKQFFQDTESKIIENGGTSTEYDNIWPEMLKEEDKIRYFGKIDNSNVANPKPVGGANSAEIKANPEKYGVCDGWLISFTTDEKEIQYSSAMEKTTGIGRYAIKTNSRVADYYGIYFSDRLEEYEAEKAMIPQEYLAMFIKDFYSKYIKIQKKFLASKESNDLPDSETYTCFVSTYLKGNICFPETAWYSKHHFLRCSNENPTYNDAAVGVRSVVRNVKH